MPRHQRVGRRGKERARDADADASASRSYRVASGHEAEAVALPSKNDASRPPTIVPVGTAPGT